LTERGFSDRDLADVHFLGLVPNTEMHLAYQSAECFVLASLCESFGIKILEALASGCPAIVPSTCASPEIAGGAARLINPRDEEDITQALAEVTGSEELRRSMREKGLQRARGLTWRETARRTLAVFDEIIPRSR
jgi:alpha-1,3-rhamnosyl/mannosyltransferase